LHRAEGDDKGVPLRQRAIVDDVGLLAESAQERLQGYLASQTVTIGVNVGGEYEEMMAANRLDDFCVHRLAPLYPGP